MAEPKVPVPEFRFNSKEKQHILAALDMLLKSHKRAENQMRQTNRDAIAEAIKNEIAEIANVAQKAQREL